MNRPLAILLGTFLTLSGCGGTKMIKEPEPLVLEQPIAAQSDTSLDIKVDWVIVRDGPGTWAKNADWDEYLIRVENTSSTPVTLTSMKIYDSMLTVNEPLSTRADLVKASRQAIKRYKNEGIEIKAGVGTSSTLLIAAADATVLAGAYSAGPALAYGSTAAAGAAIAAIVIAPVLLVGGVVKGINSSKVSREIEKRSSYLPLTVEAGETIGLDLFYPLVPSPQRIEASYQDATGQHLLAIDLSQVLDGLHQEKPKNP